MARVDATLLPFSAVVLAGGRGSRLGGADKAGIEVGGRTLLSRALDAVVDAREVVVVGEQVPTERPVTFTREDPQWGGPVAALLAGVDVLLRDVESLVVVAVDMPHLDALTVRRLRAAAAEGAGEADGAAGVDGAVLVDPGGRRQLALALATAAVRAARPPYEEVHGMPLHRLLDALDLVDVPAEGLEHLDVDTWADLRDLAD